MLKEMAIILALIFTMVGSVLLPYSLIIAMVQNTVTLLGIVVLAITIGLVVYSWVYIRKIFSSSRSEAKTAGVFLVVLSVFVWSFSAYVMISLFQIRTM